MILIRYGEIFLKGLNKASFENKLVQNIVYSLKRGKIEYREIGKKRNRIFIDANKADLTKVFGIHSFSNAVECETELEKIKECVLLIIRNKKFKTFKINAKRSDKKFKYRSLELNRILGDFVLNKLNGKKVRLEKPELEIGVDILDKAYIFTEKIKGAGGLPVGIEGRVILLVENEASILAGLLVMKRGCEIIPVGFGEFNIDLLNKYSNKELKLEIIKDIKEIDDVAEKDKAKAVVVNQTLNDFKELDIKTPLLRPLIGYDSMEIKNKIKEFSN